LIILKLVQIQAVNPPQVRRTAFDGMVMAGTVVVAAAVDLEEAASDVDETSVAEMSILASKFQFYDLRFHNWYPQFCIG